MSENIPESVPTSSDRRSHRPLKRRALSPVSKQAAHLDALFANPDKPIVLPTSAAITRLQNAPPEIVANVQGSSAGAGSGEFHVYKASRRREYERLRAMDEEKEKEDGGAAFEAKREEMRKKDAEKTEKNRLKREKARQRASKKKGPKEDDVDAVQKANKFKANAAAEKRDLEGELDEVKVAPEEVGIVIHDED